MTTFTQNRAAPKDAIMVNQYSIHLNLCMMHRLLFHETFSPSATYRPIMWSVGGRNGDVKGTYHVTIFYNYAALWMCLMLIKPALFYQKYRKNCNIVKYYNLKECLSILINFKILFIYLAQLNFQYYCAWSFRNHSNMLIYYQYWKQLCCLKKKIMWWKTNSVSHASCDTEDWSSDVEKKSFAITGIKYKSYFKL